MDFLTCASFPRLFVRPDDLAICGWRDMGKGYVALPERRGAVKYRGVWFDAAVVRYHALVGTPPPDVVIEPDLTWRKVGAEEWLPTGSPGLVMNGRGKTKHATGRGRPALPHLDRDDVWRVRIAGRVIDVAEVLLRVFAQLPEPVDRPHRAEITHGLPHWTKARWVPHDFDAPTPRPRAHPLRAQLDALRREFEDFKASVDKLPS